MKRVPWALLWLRAGLGPAIVAMARTRVRGAPMALAIFLAVLSDIFDGVVARRLGTETALLRRSDSAVDTLFYLCAAWAAWILAPGKIRSVSGTLVAVFGLELFRYIFDFLKFHREASYHAYSAKAWGLFLALALILLLAYNIAGWLLTTSLWVGILANVEGLTISYLLPSWSHDVPSAVHAYKLRQRVLHGIIRQSLD